MGNNASLLLAAVYNNARWCDDVCRAHGLSTHMDDALWRCMQPTPRFYPNAVTLNAHAQAAQLAHIAALAAAAPSGEVSVKDSFAALDLTPRGFAVYLEATWIARAAPPPVHAATDLAWTRVHSREQLARWEEAWATDEAASPSATFQPPLLHNADLFILAAQRGGELVAGGILSRTSTSMGVVVGLSNAFAASGEDARACWIQLAGLAAQYAPGCPVVGYESGAPLEWALDAGFAALHPLRIWGGRTAS